MNKLNDAWQVSLKQMKNKQLKFGRQRTWAWLWWLWRFAPFSIDYVELGLVSFSWCHSNALLIWNIWNEGPRALWINYNVDGQLLNSINVRCLEDSLSSFYRLFRTVDFTHRLNCSGFNSWTCFLIKKKI